MAIDDHHNGQPAPPPAGNVVANGEGIVSVNDRGRRSAGRLQPFLMLGGIALVVLIGGLLTVKVVKAKLSGAKPVAQASTASLAGLQRTFDTDGAPPLPGASSAPATAAVATVPTCPDGSTGNDLRGQGGEIVRNANGESLKVCANGQVLGPTAAQGNVQPIPVQPTSRRPVAASTAGEGTPRAAHSNDGPMMIADQKPSGLASVAGLTDPQAALTAVEQAATGAQSKTEGLLTAPPAGSLEAELQPSKTPMVQAARLDDLNMLIPRGRSIECGMSMRIISALAGQASCIVTQNVYSANGKVVLLERGSEAVGEYRSGASIGQKRLFVLWTRILTPGGVVINLDSPGADELGSTGLTGRVDSHWWERVGSAFLLSTIQDAIQYGIAEQQARSGGATIVLGNTAQAGNSMAEKVLASTVDIPPTIYKNQGDRAIIYVARDLDFSNVYKLAAKP
jgi:type IV secretion system protein VirB10